MVWAAVYALACRERDRVGQALSIEARREAAEVATSTVGGMERLLHDSEIGDVTRWAIADMLGKGADR
jgi:hypothetical protein